MIWKLLSKTLALSWIFTIAFFGLLITTGHSTNVRNIAGHVGILKVPETESLEAFKSNVEAAFFSVKTQAQQNVRVIDTPVRGLLIAEFSLQAAIRSAVVAFINSIVQTLLNYFNQLVDVIEDAVNSMTGLKLNLGSFRAAVAGEVYAIKDSIIRGFDEIYGGAGGIQNNELRGYNENCYSLYMYNSLVNYSQETQPESKRQNTMSEADLTQLRQNCALLGGKSMCSNGDIVPGLTPLLGPDGTGGGCVKELSALLDTNIRDDSLRMFRVFDRTIDKYDNCEDVGEPAGIILASGSGSDLATTVSQAASRPGQLDSALGNGPTTEQITSEFCNIQDENFETTRESLLVDRSTPESNILSSILSALQDLYTQLINQLIESVLGAIFDAIDSFINFGNGFFSGIGQALNQGAKAIAAGYLNEANKILNN